MPEAKLLHGPADGRLIKFDSLPYVIYVPVQGPISVRDVEEVSRTPAKFVVATYTRTSDYFYVWDQAKIH